MHEPHPEDPCARARSRRDPITGDMVVDLLARGAQEPMVSARVPASRWDRLIVDGRDSVALERARRLAETLVAAEPVTALLQRDRAGSVLTAMLVADADDATLVAGIPLDDTSWHALSLWPALDDAGRLDLSRSRGVPGSLRLLRGAAGTSASTGERT